MTPRHFFVTTALAVALFPGLAYAGEPAGTPAPEGSETSEASDEPAAGGAVSVGAGGANAEGGARGPKAAKSKDRGDIKWIKRWAPERNMLEIGVAGGVLSMHPKTHELYEWDLDQPNLGYQGLRQLNPDIALRVGYYPLRVLGVEVEGNIIPNKTEGGQSALMGVFRGGVVLQLPFWSITPFVSVAGGVIGVSSDRNAVGKDQDVMMHAGGGIKAYLNRYVALRLDVRDVITHKRGDSEVFNSHNLEALLGISVTLGRKKEEKKADPTPDGPRDTDGDGYMDPDDQCVDQAETFNEYMDEDGCPESDRDGDGFWDDQDQCPDQAGVGPDGCPVKDTDGDGILDPDDQCVDKPETKNGYQDGDGCPDELPKEVAKFVGVIEGILFDTDKDTIKPGSKTILDKAVKVLKDFPDAKIKITGHTDSAGDRDHNMELSRNRAAAVKQYLVDAGLDGNRFTTDGVGPDSPRADNGSKKGRAQNRRIEFALAE